MILINDAPLWLLAVTAGLTTLSVKIVWAGMRWLWRWSQGKRDDTYFRNLRESDPPAPGYYSDMAWGPDDDGEFTPTEVEHIISDTNHMIHHDTTGTDAPRRTLAPKVPGVGRHRLYDPDESVPFAGSDDRDFPDDEADQRAALGQRILDALPWANRPAPVSMPDTSACTHESDCPAAEHDGSCQTRLTSRILAAVSAAPTSVGTVAL